VARPAPPHQARIGLVAPVRAPDLRAARFSARRTRGARRGLVAVGRRVVRTLLRRDAISRRAPVGAGRDKVGLARVLIARTQVQDRAEYLEVAAPRQAPRRFESRRARGACDGRADAGPRTSCWSHQRLSSSAIDRHGASLVEAVWARLVGLGLELGPIVAVPNGRVAVGDDVGEALGTRSRGRARRRAARLSSSDGRDLSHVRARRRDDGRAPQLHQQRPLTGGLPYDAAAAKLAWLVEGALRRQLSGVALKDEAPRRSRGAGPTRTARCAPRRSNGGYGFVAGSCREVRLRTRSIAQPLVGVVAIIRKTRSTRRSRSGAAMAPRGFFSAARLASRLRPHASRANGPNPALLANAIAAASSALGRAHRLSHRPRHRRPCGPDWAEIAHD